MFVLKLNSSGAYQWHTFFQPGRAKAIDVTGSDVYVAGIAASSWETPTHAFKPGGNSLVALKFNSAGDYQWHTYYGLRVINHNDPKHTYCPPTLFMCCVCYRKAPNNWLGDGDAPLCTLSVGAPFQHGPRRPETHALRLPVEQFYGAAR
jgi:hypothetical protein